MDKAENTAVADTKSFHIGDLVEIGEPPGVVTRAVVYDVFESSENEPAGQGISLISEEGLNLGDWEFQYIKHVRYVQSNTLLYQFHSLSRLARDFEKGLFSHCFQLKE